MTQISGPVGIRNRTLQVRNAVADQLLIIGLLSLLRPEDGGQRGVWTPPPGPGPAGNCPTKLADAIRAFQNRLVQRSELRSADGVVDPGGTTLRKLDELVAAGLLIGPSGVDPTRIRLRQTNPSSMTDLHDVTQQVISPLTVRGQLQEIPQTGSMREFLFEMRKDGAVYWVGAAVPQGTTDFTKVQVFFHPTVVQHKTVHATEGDYPLFRGGWSTKLKRYVARQGGQIAGARQTALIVPFMTMAAFTGKAPAYMFGTRAKETLDAIMTAVRDASTPGAPSANAVLLSRMGVTSFSSGIGAMRLFIKTFGNSGLIVETTDFDSPFIIAEPKIITTSPGALGRVFSQVGPLHANPLWVTMPPDSFRQIRAHRDKGPHSQIGRMMFFAASLSSVVL